MSWFFSSKTEDTIDKKFDDTVALIQKASPKDIPQLYSEIIQFVPQKSALIVEKLLNNIVVILSKPPVSKELPFETNLFY